MFIETYKSDHIPLSDAFGVPYPDAFSHPRLEYEMLTRSAGILDVSHWGVLRMTGTDRVTFLNAMVTQNVAALGKGSSCAALLTTTKGKIVAQLLVLARPDELVVLVMQGETARVVDVLESHIIADDVVLENVSHAFDVLSIQGPTCRDLVWRVFPREALPLKPFEFTENAYQDIRATVVRHSITGDKGLHVIVPHESAGLLRQYLVQGGIGIDCGPVGRTAWNMRRVENGLPWFGVDIETPEGNFPKEARLDDHVSYDKGCYLGQETIARMHHRGHPNWLLIGLALESGGGLRYDERWEKLAELPTLSRDAAAARADIHSMTIGHATGAELRTDTGEVSAKAEGRITSAAYSPQLKRALFLGYVRAPLAEAGASFHATIDGAPAILSAVDLPLKGD